MSTPSLESKRSALVSEISVCARRRSIRARMAGRQTERLAQDAIGGWCVLYDGMQAEEIIDDLTNYVERKHGLGPVATFLLLAVLSSLIRIVVTELVYWWIERKEERGPLLLELRGLGKPT